MYTDRQVHIIRIGGAAALAVALSAGSLALLFSFWRYASSGGRAALAVLVAGALTFAVTVFLYIRVDLGKDYLESVQVRSNSAPDLVIDGSPVKPLELPQILPRYNGGRLVGIILRGGDRDRTKQAVFQLIVALGRAGSLSRRKVLPHLGNTREARRLYDWCLGSFGLLPVLGLVNGRGPRSSGRLRFNPRQTAAVVSRIFRNQSSDM